MQRSQIVNKSGTNMKIKLVTLGPSTIWQKVGLKSVIFPRFESSISRHFSSLPPSFCFLSPSLIFSFCFSLTLAVTLSQILSAIFSPSSLFRHSSSPSHELSLSLSLCSSLFLISHSLALFFLALRLSLFVSLSLSVSSLQLTLELSLPLFFNLKNRGWCGVCPRGWRETLRGSCDGLVCFV